MVGATTVVWLAASILGAVVVAAAASSPGDAVTTPYVDTAPPPAAVATTSGEGGGSPVATFVGSQRCGTCHPGGYATWQLTPHSKASSAAAPGGAKEASAGAPQEGECASCHTTGWDRGTGTWVEAGVGCEACHGPGGGHAGDPATQHLPARISTQPCGGCHFQGVGRGHQGTPR